MFCSRFYTNLVPIPWIIRAVFNAVIKLKLELPIIVETENVPLMELSSLAE